MLEPRLPVHVENRASKVVDTDQFVFADGSAGRWVSVGKVGVADSIAMAPVESNKESSVAAQITDDAEFVDCCPRQLIASPPSG